MAKRIKKQNLPQKICLVCERPFAWRKKWQKDWENVKYCSDRSVLKSQKNTEQNSLLIL